ncbi:cell wall hydrolase [Geomonas sp.]|uniref:cell wall hydrolase n=1 Tax=Geomonas sp. TaxID=2651584 RepID=UPI002B49DA68|nr:cell wall hydrolase [Geomonas sp.]HJV34614.1 cell wall hydrolase [Geomonas sp.]
MRELWIVIGMVALLSTGEAAASDQAQKVETAEKKAHVLEKKAAGEGGAVPIPAAVKIKKVEVQAVDPAGKGALDNAITCLSRSIYWEARGDGAAGMEAIANVVMNRVGHQGFPDSVCKVVKEGRQQGVCQFSWWCDHRSHVAKDEKSYALAKEISRKALNRQLPDRTHGALYFHHRKVHPSWSKKYIKTVQVGELVFYKPRGGTAK